MEYISDFENYLRENGKAKKTIESYTGDVSSFVGFLSEKASHLTVSSTVLR